MKKDRDCFNYHESVSRWYKLLTNVLLASDYHKSQHLFLTLTCLCEFQPSLTSAKILNHRLYWIQLIIQKFNHTRNFTCIIGKKFNLKVTNFHFSTSEKPVLEIGSLNTGLRINYYLFCFNLKELVKKHWNFIWIN